MRSRITGVQVCPLDHCGGRFHGTKLSRESGAGKVYFYDMSESLDNLRIELDTSPAIQLIQCLSEGASHAVGTFGGHRIKGICYCQDPCKKGNLVSHESIGIAPSIPPFVMMADDGFFSGEVSEVLHDLLADHRVYLNNFVLC